MSEDIIEAKPGAFGISINLNALLRRFKETDDLTLRVARRFIALFRDHGIERTEIPQFIPQLTLDKLKSDDALLGSLSNEVLSEAATLFGIRREWLDTADERLYPHRSCYKNPNKFFKDHAHLQTQQDIFPVRVLHSADLNNKIDRSQPLVIVVVERIRDIGEREICRYQVYSDAWDWAYWPCRIQLKAMVRTLDHCTRTPVPLYRVQAKVLDEVRSGKRVPRAALAGCPITNPSLEDFALAPEESKVAKETEELSQVEEYMRHHNLSVP
jgi:hypothetical protein